MFLILIHIKINGIGVGCRSSWCLAGGWRTVASLRTAAGSNKANGGAGLTLQLGHGIGLALATLAFSFLGLLAPGNGLGCNEVDIGAVYYC
jgi:hypothetical protein